MSIKNAAEGICTTTMARQSASVARPIVSLAITFALLLLLSAFSVAQEDGDANRLDQNNKGSYFSLTENDRQAYNDSNVWQSVAALEPFSYSKKYYWEVDYVNGDSIMVGIAEKPFPLATWAGRDSHSYSLYSQEKFYLNGIKEPTEIRLVVGDRLMVAYDPDTGSLWYGVNGTWSGDPVLGTDPMITGLEGLFYPLISMSNATALVAFASQDLLYEIPNGFTVSRREDYDKDGLIDLFETQYFGNLDETAEGDYDNDGITNRWEAILLTDPTDGESDSDNDGLRDDWELLHFKSLSQTSDADPDLDGVTNIEEFIGGSDPNYDPYTNRLDPDNKGSYFSLTENDRQANNGSGVWQSVAALEPLSHGKKYYWEVDYVSGESIMVGIAEKPFPLATWAGQDNHSYSLYSQEKFYRNGIKEPTDIRLEVGDRLMVAYDPDAGSLWYGVNGNWSGDPVLGTDPMITGLNGLFYPLISMANAAALVAFASQDLRYEIPDGFVVNRIDYDQYANRLDPNNKGSTFTLSKNNRQVYSGSGVWQSVAALEPFYHGKKYYWEVDYVSGESIMVGIAEKPFPLATWAGQDNLSYSLYSQEKFYRNGIKEPTEIRLEVGDRLMVAYDPDTGSLWYGVNGIWRGDPALNVDPMITGLNGLFYPLISMANATALVAFASQDLLYEMPDGFVASRIEDYDRDGLRDSFEIQYFGNLDETAEGDYDNDGVTNQWEALLLTDPTDGESDSDEDGLRDAWELLHFKGLSQNPDADPDLDGLTNIEEFTGGSDPNYDSGANRLDPDNKGSYFSLTDNDYQVNSDSGVWQSVAALEPFYHGKKYYWEVDYVSGESIMVGIAEKPFPLATWAGQDNHSYSLYSQEKFYRNGIKEPTAIRLEVGDRLMVAYDPDAGSLWYGVNGTWTGDPALGTDPMITGLKGLFYPLISMSNAAAFVALARQNMLYEMPDGFVASRREDYDRDGLRDSFEIQYFGNLDETAEGDYDNDGVTNQWEDLLLTDPTDGESDADADGVGDAWEILHFESLSQAADADPDLDGATNIEEFVMNADPNYDQYANRLDPDNNGSYFSLSENDRKAYNGSGVWQSVAALEPFHYGKKYYWEVDYVSGESIMVGIAEKPFRLATWAGQDSHSYSLYSQEKFYRNGIKEPTEISLVVGDRLMVAYDPDAGSLWYGVNGSWTGDPVLGTDPMITGLEGLFYPLLSMSSATVLVAFAPQDMLYDVPEGFDASLRDMSKISGAVSNKVNPLATNTSYEVVGDVSLRAGDSWTIPRGTTLSFSSGATLTVSGELSVTGISDNPAVFTSAADEPQIGDWDGIHILAGDNSTVNIDHAIIEYAELGINFDNSGSRGRVTNSVLNYNQEGISLDGDASPLIHYNRIALNEYGVTVTNNSLQPVITENDLYNNLTTSLNVNGFSGPELLDATANWWGADGITSVPGDSDYLVDTSNTQTGPLHAPTLLAQLGDYSYISPETSPGIQDAVLFTGNLSEDADWLLTVVDSKGAVVNTLSGTGNSITFNWTGQDSDLAPVDDGWYWIRIDAEASGDPTRSGYAGHYRVWVDNTVPAATIISPSDSDVVQNVVTLPIRGSAYDANVKEYDLTYEGEDGRATNLTKYASLTSINDILLSNWVISTNLGDPAVVIPNGNYTLRISVSDKAGNTSAEEASITIDNLVLTNIATDITTIDVASDTNATFSCTLNMPSDISLYIYSESSLGQGEPLAIVTQNITDPSECGIAWDGRDTNGNFVPSGGYLYAMVASDGTRIGNYNPVYTPYVNIATNTSNAKSGTFNTFENDWFDMSYTISKPARIQMVVDLHYGAQDDVRIYPYGDGKVFEAGTHTLSWNGFDLESGLPYEGTFAYGVYVTDLPDNYLIVSGSNNAMAIGGQGVHLEVKADPYRVTLSYGQLTHLNYRLQTTLDIPAQVEIKLLPPGVSDFDDPAAILAHRSEQSTGDYTIPWDGVSDDDINDLEHTVAEDGIYVFAIRATLNGTSTTYRGVIDVLQ